MQPSVIILVAALVTAMVGSAFAKGSAQTATPTVSISSIHFPGQRAKSVSATVGGSSALISQSAGDSLSSASAVQFGSGTLSVTINQKP